MVMSALGHNTDNEIILLLEANEVYEVIEDTIETIEMLTDLIGVITRGIEVTTETDTGGMSLLEVIVVDTQKETIMITEIIGLHLIQDQSHHHQLLPTLECETKNQAFLDPLYAFLRKNSDIFIFCILYCSSPSNRLVTGKNVSTFITLIISILAIE